MVFANIERVDFQVIKENRYFCNWICVGYCDSEYDFSMSCWSLYSFFFEFGMSVLNFEILKMHDSKSNKILQGYSFYMKFL